MEIRRASTDDIESITKLYRENHAETYRGLLSEEYFSRPTPDYTKKKWSTYLQNPGNIIWVAYESDAFLGFAAGTKDAELEHTWYLDSLHITPDAQGKGIGTRLIETMKHHASQLHCSQLSVCIVRGNETARTLYTKLGAKHFSYFDDDFCGTISHSEKLVWPL